MKLKAVLEVSIMIKEDESVEEANARAIEKLIEVCDDWLNNDGITPYIKIEYDVDFDYIKEIKLLN
jgi:lipoate-protein ligase A